MKNRWVVLLSYFLITPGLHAQQNELKKEDFILVFGSCNKQNKPQPFWKDMIKQHPDLFIWAGDNVYADTDNMNVMKQVYLQQNQQEGYLDLKKVVPIMGTWDDHDYGKNDAGVEWKMKKESQQLFLDFMDVPDDSPRRKQEGVFTSQVFEIPQGSIKVIVLDTRYFRTALRRSTTKDKKYTFDDSKEATILGETQWRWFEQELKNSYSDFTVVVSSIQLISGEHGFETWGNFPNEIERFKYVLQKHKTKNVIVLSGDRHISELSQWKISGLNYPLIDFTSSGLTHSYSSYKGESNKYRLGNVVFVPSYGVLRFDLDSYQVRFQMIGRNNVILQEYQKKYPF